MRRCVQIDFWVFGKVAEKVMRYLEAMWFCGINILLGNTSFGKCLFICRNFRDFFVALGNCYELWEQPIYYV